MVYLRTAYVCAVALLAILLNLYSFECRKIGGISGGVSRSWSSSSGSRSWSTSSGSGNISPSYIKPSRFASNSKSGSWNSPSSESLHRINIGKITKPTSHSSAHILPSSSGARKPATSVLEPKITSKVNERVQKSNAPKLNSQTMSNGGSSNNPYAPSAPPLPSGTNHQPPAPGWNIGNNRDGNIPKNNVQSLNNPPPYPGSHNPGAPPPPYSGFHNPSAPPPPYPGIHNPSAPPPPYPGGVNNYPGPPHSGVPPPPYPGYSNTHYPGSGRLFPGMSGSNNNYQHHYPTHSGTSVYNQQYYPAPNNLPPPPPGYSPYGIPYYQKPKSGISGSDVMMGLALWQLTRPRDHHHYYSSYSDPGYGYHEFNRQRYTTTYGIPNNRGVANSGNTLEMTHYVVPNNKGTYATTVGNMTCLSVYDAQSVSLWANRTMKDFYKKFPNSNFPLFDTGKNATSKFENFTMIPGRIIHQESISVTCCGTDKGPVELSMLTNGKSPDVNCIHFLGKIPFRKLTFVKIENVALLNNSKEDWKPIQLVEPDLNATTPTPLAPYPINFNNSIVNSTTPVDLSQTFSSLGMNSTTTTVPSIDISSGSNASTNSSDIGQNQETT